MQLIVFISLLNIGVTEALNLLVRQSRIGQKNLSHLGSSIWQILGLFIRSVNTKTEIEVTNGVVTFLFFSSLFKRGIQTDHTFLFIFTVTSLRNSNRNKSNEDYFRYIIAICDLQVIIATFVIFPFSLHTFLLGCIFNIWLAWF